MRVGSLLVARKRGWKLAGKKLSDEDQLKQYIDEDTVVADRDIIDNKKGLLKLRKLPYEEWCGGAFVLLVTFLLIWIIRTEMAECERHNGVNAFLFFMLIAGFAIIIRGQVVTTTFEGEYSTGTMMVVRSNIFCMRMYECFATDEIKEVIAVRRGQK